MAQMVSWKVGRAAVHAVEGAILSSIPCHGPRRPQKLLYEVFTRTRRPQDIPHLPRPRVRPPRMDIRVGGAEEADRRRSSSRSDSIASTLNTCFMRQIFQQGQPIIMVVRTVAFRLRQHTRRITNTIIKAMGENRTITTPHSPPRTGPIRLITTTPRMEQQCPAGIRIATRTMTVQKGRLFQARKLKVRHLRSFASRL